MIKLARDFNIMSQFYRERRVPVSRSACQSTQNARHSIDAVHRRISGKITALSACFQQARPHIGAEAASALLGELERAACMYKISTVTVLSAYYAAPFQDEDLADRYYQLIDGECLDSQITATSVRCAGLLENAAAKVRIPRQKKGDSDRLRAAGNGLRECAGGAQAGGPQRAGNAAESPPETHFEAKARKKAIRDLISALKSARQLGDIRASEVAAAPTLDATCICGAVMRVSVGELLCPECGRVEQLDATSTQSECLAGGARTHQGDYKSIRHYRYWMDRITGVESRDLSEYLPAIERIIARDNINRRALSVRAVRAIFVECGLTDLNDHAVLIMVRCGGAPPPLLSHAEERVLERKFRQVMQLYEKVIGNAGNKRYYPYFIGKLIEQQFAPGHPKRRLLDYIHAQSRATVIRNDLIYQRICEAAGENSGLVYAPS